MYTLMYNFYVRAVVLINTRWTPHQYATHHLSLLDSTIDLSLAELAINGGLFVLSLQFVYFSEGKRD